jgi:hypothetical protein
MVLYVHTCHLARGPVMDGRLDESVRTLFADLDADEDNLSGCHDAEVSPAGSDHRK